MNHIIHLTNLFFLGFILSCTVFFSLIYAEQTEPVNVSRSEGKSNLAQISILDDDIYIVWRDNSTDNDDIYFSKSSDGGLNFRDHVNLSNNTGDSAFPRTQIVGENIYVTWYDYTPGQSDIFFAKSFDIGNSFKTINLSDNEGVSYNPWIASQENHVYVVWNDETPDLKRLNITKPKNTDVTLGNLDILLATSHDGGSTFEINNLSDSMGFSWNPRIAIYQNYVYVVWNEKTESGDEIFFAASSDNGQSFSKPINLSRTDTSSKDAAIKVSGNNVYVIWQESTVGTDILFTKSDNNGISFSDPIKISNTSSEITRDAQMVAFKNNVYIVSFNKSTDGGSVFFVQSEDYGKSFSTPVNLSGKSPNTSMAQIAVSNDNLYVIWEDKRFENTEVFLRVSNDRGHSFGSIVNISNDQSESNLSILGPQVAAINNKVYIIFEKQNESGSDLFLVQRDINQWLHNGTIILQTINGAINIETKLDKEKIDVDEPITLNLKFFDASTNQVLNQVNYSLKIDDLQGNNLLTRTNLLAENGVDNQTLTFAKQGHFKIIIFVEEAEGITIQEIDMRSTDKIITVIPEFPVGTLIVIVFIMSIAIILSKLKKNYLSTFQVS